MGGGQGQDLRRREPVLIGEDGVDPGRVEEHLQGKGEAGGGPVIVILLNNISLFFYAADRNTNCNCAEKRYTEADNGRLFSVVAVLVSIDSYVALVMTW